MVRDGNEPRADKNLLLAIESSCDETAAAVVAGGRQLLGHCVHSQIDLHAAYGGVVPELAARDHLAWAIPVVESALTQAGVRLEAVEAIAVTAGPGLVGPLLVGLQTAKGLALAANKCLVPVNHLVGHISAIRLEEDPPGLPFLALLVSGGHTALYQVDEDAEGRWVPHRISSTRDDAAGEAFDKSARLLGFAYPGGVALDQLAEHGDPGAMHFPRGLLRGRALDFSFSGLKTSVRLWVEREGIPEGQRLSDLCASIREAIVEPLVKKTLYAAQARELTEVVLCGGVAANGRLRSWLKTSLAEDGRRLHVPRVAYCTDNAAMIGAAGWMAYQAGERAPMSLNADPGWRPE